VPFCPVFSVGKPFDCVPLQPNFNVAMDQNREENTEVFNEENNAEQENQQPADNNAPEQRAEPGADGNQVAALQAELQEQKDKYVRLFAEFDNFKRRNARERIELIQTAGKEVISSLLEVLDDCDRAEKQLQTTTDIAQAKEGVQLVFNKLRNTLDSKGVKPMQSIGTDFDVEKHEAITEIEAGKENKGKVVDEVVKGYYLNDKLIRFAKVVVGK
jgi:molecular chaperone GrpE